MRSCRLLRRLSTPPRDRPRQRQPTPDHPIARAARGMGLVLHRPDWDACPRGRRINQDSSLSPRWLNAAGLVPFELGARAHLHSGLPRAGPPYGAITRCAPKPRNARCGHADGRQVRAYARERALEGVSRRFPDDFVQCHAGEHAGRPRREHQNGPGSRGGVPLEAQNPPVDELAGATAVSTRSGW